MGLCDAVKLMVKQEPHSSKKLEEGRVRLICCVSVIDNIITDLLCSTQNKAEIEVWKDIPHKPGMGLHDEGLEALYENVLSGERPNNTSSPSKKLAEADISGWDWSMQEYEFTAEIESRLDLNSGRGTVWERLIRNHYHCMARKLFVSNDGDLIEQQEPGLMPSGWKNTSRTNSFVRALNHITVQIATNAKDWWCIVMGDDGVERFNPQAQEYYRFLSKECKMYNEVNSSKFEFCSTTWSGSPMGSPNNVDKMLMNFLNSKPQSYSDAMGLLGQFQQEMRHNDEWPSILQLLKDCGWRTMCDAYLEKFWNGMEVDERPLQVHTSQQPGIHLEAGNKNSIGSSGVKAQNCRSVLNKMPRDCTELSSGCLPMYSPVSSLQYPIQMNKKQQNKKRTVKRAKQSTSTALVVRPKAAPAMQGGRVKTKSEGSAGLPPFTMAQLNPFAPQAFGAKVPDEATMPSATAFSRDLVPISIGVTLAGAGYVFRFGSQDGFVPLSPVTSVQWSSPTFASATDVGNSAALAANFAALRTVAFGIKLMTRQSAFTASGYVHIALVPEVIGANNTTFLYPTTVGLMQYSPYYRKIPIADLIEDEIIVCGKYTDVGTAFRYLAAEPSLDVNPGYTEAAPTSGWSGIMVWVESTALNIPNIVDVEVIHHYEALVQNSGTGGVIDITRAAPHSPGALAATSYVTDRMEPIQVIKESSTNAFPWKKAGDLFSVGLKIASGVFPMVGPLSAAFDAFRM